MNIHITINSFRSEIDSEDGKVKAIMAAINSDDSLDLLMKRQVIAARKLAEAKAEVVFWQLIQNLSSDAYSKLSVPHFYESVAPKEKCFECGKLTAFIWVNDRREHNPHCKNNEKPLCYNELSERIPLDSGSQNLLELFLDEQS